MPTTPDKQPPEPHTPTQDGFSGENRIEGVTEAALAIQGLRNRYEELYKQGYTVEDTTDEGW